MCVYNVICISVCQYLFVVALVLRLAVWLGSACGELLVRRWIDEGHHGLTNETWDGFAALPLASTEWLFLQPLLLISHSVSVLKPRDTAVLAKLTHAENNRGLGFDIKGKQA